VNRREFAENWRVGFTKTIFQQSASWHHIVGVDCQHTSTLPVVAGEMEGLRGATADSAVAAAAIHLLNHRNPSSNPTSAPSSMPSLAPFPEEPEFVNAQIITTITLVLCALLALLALSIQRHIPVDRSKEYVRPRYKAHLLSSYHHHQLSIDMAIAISQTLHFPISLSCWQTLTSTVAVLLPNLTSHLFSTNTNTSLLPPLPPLLLHTDGRLRHFSKS
jgi:hypothetical protein